MSIYLYIAAMALTTYLIRMLPLVLLRKPIRSVFLRSVLFYVPYACLSAMTIPAIFSSTSSIISAVAGFLIALLLSIKGLGLVVVAVSACVTVYVTELILPFIG